MGSSDKYGESFYDLDHIKALLARGKAVVTRRARQGAVSLGYASEEEIIERVLQLRSEEIYKTMPSEQQANTWQDVYHSAESTGKVIYIKIQVSKYVEGVIISFKER